MTTRKTIELQRSFDASMEHVWELWTTKQGIESWWGPEGFSVEVLTIEVRPGGQLIYAMTATAEPQIAFMKQAGMALTTNARVTFIEVARHQRIAFVGVADFIPGVAPYPTATTIDFTRVANGVRLVITLAPMHDELWTGRMAAGWESQLGKLEQITGKRG